MSSFAPIQQHQPRREPSSAPARPRASASAANQTNNLLHAHGESANQLARQTRPTHHQVAESSSAPTPTARTGHDFSRVGVYSKAPAKVQTKLKVSTPGDIYEQEADSIADHVMRMSEPQLQRACPCGGRCTECQTKHQGANHAQLKSTGDTHPASAPVAEADIFSADSDGEPLPRELRSFFEPRFGYDFSRVRIHTDAQAGAAAQDMNAHAFTLGQHVFFGDGAFRPTTRAGQSLIAHELAHTIQQETVAPRYVQRAAAEIPHGVLPQNCYEGLFALPPSPGKPLFESGQRLAVGWVQAAQDKLKKERDGTASPAEAAFVRQTFSARFGERGAFAGMRKVDNSGVAKPRVAQTAEDVVLGIVDGVERGLPKLQPAQSSLPAPGSPLFLDLEGRRAETQRTEVVTTGIPVYCEKAPSQESCPATAAAVFIAQDNAIAVCDSFFKEGEAGRAAIIIHELVHAFVQPGVTDVYTHNRLFDVLQAAPDSLGRTGGLALNNPDSITQFIRVLAEGATSRGHESAPVDTLEGFGANELDVRLALGWAHQRAKLAQSTITDITSALQMVSSIVVGGAGGSSQSMQWGSERDKFIGCRIQRIFQDTDRRAADLGDPCGGGNNVGDGGVALLIKLYETYNAVAEAFSASLSVRHQPGAGLNLPVLWIPGTPISVLVDDSFFKLNPPERARAILLGMQKRSVSVPTGVEGAPPVAAQAGVVDDITPAHVELMDVLLADVFPVFVGTGG